MRILEKAVMLFFIVGFFVILTPGVFCIMIGEETIGETLVAIYTIPAIVVLFFILALVSFQYIKNEL